MTTGNKWIGRWLPRLEDPPLVAGRGRFVGDIGFPHQLHMRVVRSPYAHAVTRRIDIAAALATPGVAAVWTGANLADLPPIDFRDPAAEKRCAPTASQSWRATGCATSASRWRRCSRPIPISPKTRRTSC